MRCFIRAVAVFFFLLSVTAEQGMAIEGYPGATWGKLKYEDPKDEIDNVVLRGWVQQGVDWFKLGKKSFFNTYAQVDYVWDREQFDWNNTFGPRLGTQIRFREFDHWSINLGAEYYWDWHYQDEVWKEGVEVYLGWYRGWNMWLGK